jgi:hypothetical protein
MNESTLVLAPLLGRLLMGGREGAERLIADLRKGARELAMLSLNFNGHSIRAGVHNAAMRTIDAELDNAASTLSRILFDVQQRLLLDVQMLTRLARIEQITDLEDDRPLAERIRHEVDAYTTALGPSLAGTRSAVADLSTRLRVLANNTEIAACRASEASHAPIELFVTIAGQMRALALRLQAIADDLTIFEQTQQGNAEAVRVAVRTEHAEVPTAGWSLGAGEAQQPGAVAAYGSSRAGGVEPQRAGVALRA